MPIRTSVLCLVLVAGSPALRAQQAPSEDEAALLALLNTPVESASKRVQRAIESPQAVEVITADQIRASGAFRLADVLRLATSVQVYDADPDRCLVTIRGVGPAGNPRTVQILVDGVPMFNFVAGPIDLNGLPVPIDAIERIEIVRGPSSSLYGANAQFGVIAITTRRVKDGATGSLRAGVAETSMRRAQAFFGYGSQGFSFTVGVAGGSNGNLDQPLANLTTGVGPVPQNTDSRYTQAFLRPEFSFGGTKLWLAYGVGDGGHTDQNSYNQATLAPVATFPDMTMTRQLFQAGWAQTWSPTFKSELKVGQKTYALGLNALEPNAANPASPTIVHLLEATDPALATRHDFYHDQVTETSLQVNWDPADTFHVVAGADTKAIKTDPCLTLGLASSETLSASGGFFSLDWSVGAATLSAGARAANETLGGSSTSPRVSLVYKLDDTSILRGGYFTSTRSPMLQEKADVIANSPVVASTAIANPGLLPEKVADFEVGYRKTWARWSLDLTWFDMTMKNLILEQPTGVVTGGKPQEQWVNAAGSYSDTGIEVALTGEVASGWFLGFNASTAAFKDPVFGLDQQADYAPKGQGTLWTRYRSGKFFSYLAIQYLDSYTVYTASGAATLRQTIDAATQAHFNVGYEPLPGLSLSVYGIDAARATSQATNVALINTFAIRTARRELGLQAGYRF